MAELCAAAGPRVELRVHADVAAAAVLAAAVARGARELVAVNLTALPGDPRIEEADRFATLARSELSPHDLTSRSSTMTTLGLVRAAQGCDEEAEGLLRDAVGLLDGTDYRLLEAEARAGLARFLRARGRVDEAAEVELRLPDPVPGWLGTADAHVAAAVWAGTL